MISFSGTHLCAASSHHWVKGEAGKAHSCWFSLNFCDALSLCPDKLSVGKRKRGEDEEIPTAVEMAENTDNPLRCPVRLYEFYLSKW